MSTNTPTRSTELRVRSPWDVSPWADLAPWSPRLSDLMQQVWPSGTTSGEFIPGVELHETDEAFELEVDLPGVDRKDITIDITGRRVRVHGTKTMKEREGILRHSTRSVGAFTYEGFLPAPVKEEEVQARLTDGVLSVTMPKATEAKTTHIEIT
jgi:HSP20 family protein